ncbi:MAG: hypothetical protein IPK50_20910 [Fibrobacterota bacterium]|nr:hypothetical protein [Fibrobacterota bacterium]QQS04712.1 MAG: hypothetical protein IPK50_20910 [Fibrobacterota bacterium]
MLVLIGVLTGLASVSWKRVTYKIRVLGAVNELRNAIQLARSDAMTRRRHSGILIDTAGKRFLRFVDSSKLTAMSDGTFTASEDSVLQDWVDLPSQIVVYGLASSYTPLRQPRTCGSASGASTTVRSGPLFPVVFRPDGSSWATFETRLGVQSFPRDTFRLIVFPPTGFVQMEN